MRKILRGIAGILIAVDVTMCSFTNISFAKDMYSVNDVEVQQNVQEQQTINTVQNEQEQYAESGRTSISKPDMEELRQLYNSLPTYDKLYKTEPVVEGEDYHISVLSDEAYDTAKREINYYRRVAGLGEITLDDELNESAAYGALALAMNNSGLTHRPGQPRFMSDEDFLKAREATESSNISAAYGYPEEDVLSVAVGGQMSDSSSSNIGTVGHRRWLLNPGVKMFGVGSADNNSNYYTDIRVFGYGVQSEDVNDYDFIAWPASGANLTDTFTSNTPWSVTLNPNVYYTPTENVSVEIKSLRYGTTWHFDKDTGYSTSSDDNYFKIETRGYGVSNCIIFRPAYENIDMFKGDYIVTVSNVMKKDTGEYTDIKYKVTFDNYAGATSINDCDISLVQNSYEYDGQEVEPEVTVKDKFTGEILKKDTDYTVNYYDNDKVGTAQAYVRGINKYTGSSSLDYEIKQGNAQLSAYIDKKNIEVGEYANITVNSNTQKYEYTSDNTSVATVTNYGTVQGNSEGTANITVSVADSNYKPEQVTLQVTVIKKQVAITDVILNTNAETLTEGDTTTLTVTVYPDDTTYSKNVSWSSNNEAVATVSEDGTVTAKSAGTAIITATSENGKTASCKITVNKKIIEITEVRLNKSTEALVEGDTTTLIATVLPENTTYSKNVSWSSNNEAVATVSKDGIVTAKSAGTAVITATSENGKSASCTITVNEKLIPITEVRLNKSTETLIEGDTTTLTATILPENTTNLSRISWNSSDETVATVSSGGIFTDDTITVFITAKSAGTAVITATSENGKSASCTITVSKEPIAITEVRLNKSAETLTEGDTTTLTATVLPENTTYSKNVNWSSNNEAVATVSEDGTVTAKSAGTAIITATSENGKTASCTITVNKKDTNIAITEVRLNKSTETLTEGDTTTLVATVLPENTTYGKSVKWSSSNVAVATVDLIGKVTAKSAGTAVITATSENGKTASCTVTVNKKDTYTGLRDVDGQLKYFNKGNIDTTYTGFADYEGNRYYVSNGIVDTTYTSLILDNENWVYIENGKVNSDYAGLVNYEGLWFYVDNGTIDWGYTGLADYNGIWFYVSGGMVDWNYAGLTYYNDVWFYISGGMIDWDYTGLVYYNDIWFYVSGGILDWDYIGLTSYNGIWFMISGGMINWDYAGLIYYNDMWFYVSGGTINWDYAGLIYYNDAWFYVSGGCINWTTAIVDYNGAKFYVQNGMVDWDYTGTVNYNGSTYNVISGMVY